VLRLLHIDLRIVQEPVGWVYSIQIFMTEISEQQSIGQSFLGRTFDAYQNMMQIAACIREAARQRAITRPYVLELSRRETGISDYLPEACIVRFATHENNQPALSMPLVLPYTDKTFDCSLITDAYEHVPPEMRPEILHEILRVTNGLVLVAAPQQNEIVSRFDRMVFDFIWGKYAERFEPLEQHILFGLEPLEQMLASLKAQGADEVLVLPCNYIYRWIHQILIFFDLQYKHTDFDLFEPLNRIYNERLSTYDYKEPCYRYLMAVATSKEIDMAMLANRLQTAREIPAVVADAEGALVEMFRAVDARLADKLRANAREFELLQGHNHWAIREIEHLGSVISQLQQHNAWAKSEAEHLNSIINQLQQDNQWASQEIQYLRSIIESQEKSQQKADEQSLPEIYTE
jgi:hypothetical protein